MHKHLKLFKITNVETELLILLSLCIYRPVETERKRDNVKENEFNTTFSFFFYQLRDKECGGHLERPPSTSSPLSTDVDGIATRLTNKQQVRGRSVLLPISSSATAAVREEKEGTKEASIAIEAAVASDGEEEGEKEGREKEVKEEEEKE